MAASTASYIQAGAEGRGTNRAKTITQPSHSDNTKNTHWAGGSQFLYHSFSFWILHVAKLKSAYHPKQKYKDCELHESKNYAGSCLSTDVRPSRINTTELNTTEMDTEMSYCSKPRKFLSLSTTLFAHSK